jgi:hypothetical protein
MLKQLDTPDLQNIDSLQSAKFGNHGKLQKFNLLRLFLSLKFFPDRKFSLNRQNSILANFDFSARLFNLTELLNKSDNFSRNSRKVFQ